MSELFLEIEEEIKRERVEQLWRRFGKLMVWLSVAVVVATAAGVAWKSHERSVAEGQTSQLLKGAELLEAKDYKAALALIDPLTEESDTPLYPVAMLRKAQAQELSGDTQGAQKTYQTLAKQETDLAGLAALKSGDEKTIAAVSTVSPFYQTVQEFKAWKLLAEGKQEDAVDLFIAVMEDERTPASQAQRLQEVVRTLAPAKAAAKQSAKQGKAKAGAE